MDPPRTDPGPDARSDARSDAPPTEAAAATAPRRSDPWWPWRRIALAGSLLVLAIAALAGYDIVRSYHEAVAETGRDLQTQARVIAEQAARSLQAVDGVLRHVAEDSRQGNLRTRTPAELNAYLKNQAVGLSQADALSIFDARGRLVASSLVADDALPQVELGEDPSFLFLRDRAPAGALVAPARLGRLLTQGWFMPVARRLETAGGDFAGAVAASVRVDYFQNFYRDVRPEPGTATARSKAGLPWVSVPVLSTMSVSPRRKCSMAAASRNRMPRVAARPVATMIDIGVASPSAQGQAMMSTATALMRP